jgi:cysteine desulfurase
MIFVYDEPCMNRSDSMIKRHYFDWAATAMPDQNNSTSDDSENYTNKKNLSGCFANPSSLHAEGRATREALEEARSRCAAALGVKADELFFTSGGTESNAIALFSLLRKPGRPGFLYSAVEHPSITENAAVLEQLGISAAKIGVEQDGRVSEATLEKALVKNPSARMAAIMAVNNETGAVNDMKTLSAVIRERRERGFHLHCDLVQAVGKINVKLHGVDSASLSAHKIGGPRGLGILWIKAPGAITPLVRGGGQEKKMRPGTENVAGALEFARVLEQHGTQPSGGTSGMHREATERMKLLFNELKKSPAFVPIPEDRQDEDSRFSPWILQCAWRNKIGKIIPGEVMVRALDEKGFAVSTGSACSAAEKKRHVLEAMGVSGEISLGGIRISQGYDTTTEAIVSLAETIRGLADVL